VRWSGPHLQKRLPCSLRGKIRPKSMARGSALERPDERLVVLPQMLLPMPGGRQAALGSSGKPVVERSAARKCVYPTGRLSGLSDGLSALCFAGAVLGIRGQRRSGASRQCRSPSVTSSCRGFAKAHHARTNTVGGCSRSSASSHLDGPLASAIR
jgi:hypothetical protein